MSDIVYACFEYQYNTNAPIKPSAYESRGLDLFMDVETGFMARPGITYEVSTGLRLCPANNAPVDTFLLPRSSAGRVKKRPQQEVNGNPPGLKSYNSSTIRLANTVALIDRDYRGLLIARFEVSEEMLIDNNVSYIQAFPVGGNNPRYQIVDSLEGFTQTARGEKWDGSSGTRG